jgi:hypothetical protein
MKNGTSKSSTTLSLPESHATSAYSSSPSAADWW